MRKKIIYLIIGLVIGAGIASIPWYYAWEKEWKQTTAKFFEEGLKSPKINSDTASKSVKKISRLNQIDFEWEFEDINGKTHQLGDFSGKVLFVNFWGTWCVPCIAELPSLEKLKNNYINNNKIDFLFLSYESSNKIKDFLVRRPEFKNLAFYKYNRKNIPELLKHKAFPTTLIFNKKGELVGNHTGMADWNSHNVIDFLDKLIKE